MLEAKISKVFGINFIIKSFLCVLAFIIFLALFPVPYSENKLVYIPKGSNTITIAKYLKEEKIIYSEYAFRILAKVLNLETKFIFGEFNIRGNIGLFSVLNYITDHKNIYYYKLTVVEGLRVVDILNVLKTNDVLTGEITIKPKEGSLMPDTYFFIKGTTRNDIVIRMQDSMTKYLNYLWDNRDIKLPYKNKNEALIMASIVEKESSFRDERSLIAGVFLNRLHLGMKLQTDPTVAYGLNRISADGLTKKDLATDHPYNTYIIRGLPPTPIANPSRQSLKAVFEPQNTDYLYFVADGNGGHVFSSNLVDHNANVSKWRKIESNIRQKQQQQAK